MQVALANENRTGFAQLPDLVTVVRGYETGQGNRAAGCRHVGSVEIVFEDNRDTVQWSAELTPASLFVQGLRVRDSIPVDVDHRIESRPLPVECLDTIEILSHQDFRGYLSTGHRGL